MAGFSSIRKNFFFIWRLAFPVICGISGILITLTVSHIPYSFSSLLLGSILAAFIIVHLVWFQKTIQPLCHDLKKLIGVSKQALSSPPSSAFEKEDTQTKLIEAQFFQALRERLNIAHQPYMQAQSLQDNRTHLIQTKGLVPLLENNQINILTQPIVNLPQKRLSFFSCLPCVTLENGMSLNLNTYTNPQNDTGSHQAIDKIVLFQTLQFIRRHHRDYPNHGFLCALPSSIYKDPDSIEEIGKFLSQTHFPFPALIFEIPLDISVPLLKAFYPLKGGGIRLAGKWPSHELPTDLTKLITPSVDFIMAPYSALLLWMKNHGYRQSLSRLNHFLDISPQIIVSDVDREQDLYSYLPAPFDFAFGKGFGRPKPFQQIQK